MTIETWLPVVGREGLYEVSNHGRVRSLVRSVPLILSPSQTRDGHLRVQVGHGRSRYVHHLVLEAFVGPRPPELMCRHLNGDPADNRVENLSWGTSAENQLDTIRHGNHREVNKTHCANGHEYSPENTRICLGPNGYTYRRCAICKRATGERHDRKRRQSAA